MKDAGWQQRMQDLVPSYGSSLVDDANLLRRVRARTLDTLKLH
jgi:malate dehydrogenase (quinone)